MKKRKIIKNRYLIIIIFLLMILVPTVITFSKYVLERNGTYNFTLRGVKFNGTNLITDNSISYTDALNTLENPERGIFIQQDVVLSNPYNSSDLDSVLTITSNVKTQLATSSITLARLVFYLDNYKLQNLSNDWLDALDEIIDSYRQDGYKVIVRFAYFRDNLSSDPDDFNQILTHMDQLESFFDTNQDVIHAVELGFIGKWGESHSSIYSTSEYRNQVLVKALEVVPSPINILVRKPEFYEDFFGQGYFDHKIGYSDQDKARVGIYDDGMLASDDDYGTYYGFRLYTSGGRTGALKWIGYLSKYTILGGEVVHIDGNESFYTLTNAFSDMKKMHVNFLNKEYDTVILNYFRNNEITNDIDVDYNGQNAYKYLKDKLGYRFLVTNTKTPNYSVKQGQNLNFSFTIKNVGFGNLVKKRPVKVIVEKDNKYYTVDTEIDPRYWFSGEEVTEEVVLKLPGNIEVGTWNIYIQLPDASASLSEYEKYYIKFANGNVWNDYFYANKVGEFTVENETNDSNNGMYQLNTIENLAVADTPLIVFRPVTVDGNKTSYPTEWINDDVVYDMYSESVSLRSVKNDLYLYIDPSAYDPTTTDIRIYFATNTSNSLIDYKYEIQNGSIYNYSNNVMDLQIGSVENNKTATGFEYKVPFASLGISSVNDLKGLKIEYVNPSNSSIYDEYIVRLDATNMIVDGRKSYSNEYEASDIFYNQNNVKIYMKIVDGYLYVYDEDADIFTSTSIDLYLGSDNPTKFSNWTRDGFIFTYRDDALMCDNASNSCPSTNVVVNSDKYKNKGAEYKIPISNLGISNVSDLRNVKFIYKNGNIEVKNVNIPYKYNTSQFAGKTVIVASKPAGWTNIYAYFYLESGPTYFAWPGVQMYEIENDSLKYAFVLPNIISPQSQYVIFDNGCSNCSSDNQMPGDNYLIYNIASGQHKYWNGTVVSYTSLDSTNAFATWHNYPSVGITDNDINFKVKIINQDWDVDTNNVCVYLYSNDSGSDADVERAWPGLTLTKQTSGYFEGTFSIENRYNNLRMIFNNCNHNKQYPSSLGILVKQGMSLQIGEVKNSKNQYYYKYYVTNDNY